MIWRANDDDDKKFFKNLLSLSHSFGVMWTNEGCLCDVRTQYDDALSVHTHICLIVFCFSFLIYMVGSWWDDVRKISLSKILLPLPEVPVLPWPSTNLLGSLFLEKCTFAFFLPEGGRGKFWIVTLFYSYVFSLSTKFAGRTSHFTVVRPHPLHMCIYMRPSIVLLKEHAKMYTIHIPVAFSLRARALYV